MSEFGVDPSQLSITFPPSLADFEGQYASYVPALDHKYETQAIAEPSVQYSVMQNRDETKKEKEKKIKKKKGKKSRKRRESTSSESSSSCDSPDAEAPQPPQPPQQVTVGEMIQQLDAQYQATLQEWTGHCKNMIQAQLKGSLILAQMAKLGHLPPMAAMPMMPTAGTPPARHMG